MLNTLYGLVIGLVIGYALHLYTDNTAVDFEKTKVVSDKKATAGWWDEDYSWDEYYARKKPKTDITINLNTN